MYEKLQEIICYDFNYTETGIDCECDKIHLTFADFLKVLKVAEGKKVEKTTDEEVGKVEYEWGV